MNFHDYVRSVESGILEQPMLSILFECQRKKSGSSADSIQEKIAVTVLIVM